MPWGAAAAVGGALIGAYATSQSSKQQSSAARDAASTQADANRYAADVQKEMFERQVELQEPWRKAGINALGRLSSGIESGQFGKVTPFQFGAKEFEAMRDPGYAFRLAEGQKALERSAAARGGLISGSALKAAQRYGQEMGSQEFGNAYERAVRNYVANLSGRSQAYNELAGVSGTGQTSAQQIGQAGQTTAANISNLTSATGASSANALLAQGQARASAYQGYGSAAGQALQGVYNNRNSFSNLFSGGNNALGPSIGSNAYNTQDAYAAQLNAAEGF
jgi:hypothetical protein